MPADCSATANCVRFVWRRALANAFRTGRRLELQDDQRVLPGLPVHPLDRVGIYLKATAPDSDGSVRHRAHADDRAVIDFEPLPTQSCPASQHQ